MNVVVVFVIYVIIGIVVSIGMVAMDANQGWGAFYYPDSSFLTGLAAMTCAVLWPIAGFVLVCTLIGKLTIYIVERFK